MSTKLEEIDLQLQNNTKQHQNEIQLIHDQGNPSKIEYLSKDINNIYAQNNPTQIQGLKQEISTIKAQNNPIKIQDLTQEISTIKAQNNPIKIQDLTQEISTIKAQNNPIKIQDLTQEISTIKAQNNPIKIQNLTQEIDDIKAQNTPTKIVELNNTIRNVGVPSGEIMAFNSSNCPSGWNELANSRGRTIVGAGTIGQKIFQFNERGGEVSHIITESEMPQHQHIVPWGESHPGVCPYGTDGSYNRIGSGKTDYDNIWCKTSKTGGSSPTNLMQPYIVKIWCVKI